MQRLCLRIMTVKDYPAVKKLLRKSFFPEEPICISSGENAEQIFEEKIEFDHLKLIRCGTSVIALQNDRPVGAVIAGTKVPSDVQAAYDEAQASGPYAWGRSMRFLSKLERDANIYKRYNVTKALYTDAGAVDRDWRGKGVGRRMISRLMEVGRAQGYPLMMAYCTSYYAVRQLEEIGLECAYSIDYANYRDEITKMAYNPPEPHKCAKVMVLRL